MDDPVKPAATTASGAAPVVNAKKVLLEPRVASKDLNANAPDATSKAADIAPHTPDVSDDGENENDALKANVAADDAAKATASARDELAATITRLGLDDGADLEDDDWNDEYDLDGEFDGEDADRSFRDDADAANLERENAGDDEEAEARRQVDAELEMNLRRAELHHVELELKLVQSEEEVRNAKEALQKAEAEREAFQRRAHQAWEDVGVAEKLIEDERARREEEDAARGLAERQAKAILRADEWRQKGNEAYRLGNSLDAERHYKDAIDTLESCGITLEEPSHLTLRTNRAAALMALGRMRDALTECELVLEINPCNVRALSRAGNCCVKLGDLAAARKHVDGISLSPDATDEDLNAALEQHQKIITASVERDRLVGNDAYRNGDYLEALRWYDAAIDAGKEAKETESVKTIKVGLHTNRAAANLMIGKPLPAAEDCCAALRLDGTHTKAQVRLARCLLQLGDFVEARQEANDVIARANAELQSKAEAKNVLRDVEIAEGAMTDVGEALKRAEITTRCGADADPAFDVHAAATKAMDDLDVAMVIAPAVPDFITLRAEALRLVGKIEEAQAIVNGKKSVNARRKALEVRLQFDLGNVTSCVEAGEHVVDLLQMLPALRAAEEKNKKREEAGGDANENENDDEDENEDEAALAELASIPDPEGLSQLLDRANKVSEFKDEGRDAFFQGNHQHALAMYQESLLMAKGAPMLEGLFLSNICACEQALGRFADALSSAGTAVSIAPTFVKAHSRLATLYTELDMLSDAEAAYKTMMKLPLEGSEEAQARTNLKAVSARAKNSRPVNWCKLLGVDAAATAADPSIKKAYRQLALTHHPDKAGRGGVSARVAAARAEMSSKLFKLVGEAQRILTNPTEKAKWATAKARADRQDAYASSRSTYSDPFDSGAYSHYDFQQRTSSTGRQSSHWASEFYADDESDDDYYGI